MKLHSTGTDNAVMSNNFEVVDFKIRATAKSFSILSSGLYANKIRAIIRELSCNAIDAHIAAGTLGTPYDVHLPSSMEPWFSIRDYGTGLSHEQVVTLFTTYFDSTKTDSNEFIGALGLGSKSPFSYTNNFTVTAVKDGRRGIYSAFISDAGVPAVALLSEDAVANEPNGLEIKLAVNEDSREYRRWSDEAAEVYRYFAHRPVITGRTDFKFIDTKYKQTDIVPGVHRHDVNHGSVAVMGNIGYPIDVPNADQTLGELGNLLNFGLELHFGIGELDFQASREGLSYIPQTIEAIRTRLEKVNGALAGLLRKEYDEISCEWAQAEFLASRCQDNFWQTSARKLATDLNHPLFIAGTTQSCNVYSGWRSKVFTIEPQELSTKYNIKLSGFTKYRSELKCSTVKTFRRYNNLAKKEQITWDIPVARSVYFVVNDTKVGATERSKFHWRHNSSSLYTSGSYHTVFVIEPVDRSKPVDSDGFLRELHNPPNVLKASELDKSERTTVTRDKAISILRLERKDSTGWWNRPTDSHVWRAYEQELSSAVTYHYIPLSGFNATGDVVMDAESIKELRADLERSQIVELNVPVFGVRKADLEAIKGKANWVNLFDHIRNTLNSLGARHFIGTACTKNRLLTLLHNLSDRAPIYQALSTGDGSLATALRELHGQRSSDIDVHVVERLMATWTPNRLLENATAKYIKLATTVATEYPMLQFVTESVSNDVLIEYVQLVNQTRLTTKQ